MAFVVTKAVFLWLYSGCNMIKVSCFCHGISDLNFWSWNIIVEWGLDKPQISRVRVFEKWSKFMTTKMLLAVFRFFVVTLNWTTWRTRCTCINLSCQLYRERGSPNNSNTICHFKGSLTVCQNTILASVWCKDQSRSFLRGLALVVSFVEAQTLSRWQIPISMDFSVHIQTTRSTRTRYALNGWITGRKNVNSQKERVHLNNKTNETKKNLVMEECLVAFQSGLKHMPNDSFLQSGVALLATPNSSVSWFHKLCDEEIKKHVGPSFSLPYSYQNGWVNNISLAKVMVAWVVGGRQGAPRKLSRQKVVSLSTAAMIPLSPSYRNKETNHMEGVFNNKTISVSEPHQKTEMCSSDPPATSHSPSPPPPLQYNPSPSPSPSPSAVALPQPSPLHETTTLEQRIDSAAWWIFEQALQLQPGSGAHYVNHLIEQVHKAALTPSPQHQQKINPDIVTNKNPLQVPPPPIRYHDSQVKVAQELFEALKQAPGYHNHDEVDFFVIVPPKRTLKVQTRERLISLLWKLCVPPFHNDRAALDYIITQSIHLKMSVLNKETRFDPTNQAWSLLSQAQMYFSQRVMSSCMFRKGEANANFNKLCQAVQHVNPATGKRKMILIIADEAHYGPKRNGQVDILFQGAAHSTSSTFPNPSNILSEPNVFIVSVSATGWNCNVVPYHRVVTWKDLPKNYNSRESYISGSNKDKMLVSHGYDALVQQCHGVNWLHFEIKRLLPSICVMVDYALAFVAIATRSFSPLAANHIHCNESMSGNGLPTMDTLRIVNHMAALTSQQNEARNTDVILIRLQQNGIQPVFVQWMKLFRSLLSPTPPPTTAATNPQQMRTTGMYKIVCPSFPDISEVPFHDSFETSLQGHRSICIVVERARIGDTIPCMSFFDLRARYKSHRMHAFSQTSFASFTQDVARAFGYQNPAPTIILNHQGWQLFQGQTTNVDKYLQRSKVPVHSLPQVVGTNEPSNLPVSEKQQSSSVVAIDPAVDAALVPHPLSMWHRVLFAASLHDPQAIKVLDHVKSNRMLLLARSQIGKTGCFIKLIELVVHDKYRLWVRPLSISVRLTCATKKEEKKEDGLRQRHVSGKRRNVLFLCKQSG